MKKTISVLLFLFFMATNVFAAQATKEEAIALVNKAVAEIKSSGDAALIKINDPNGEYYLKEKALYAFVYDENCVIKAHPYKPNLVGKSFKGKPDVRGKKFRDKIVRIAIEKGEGWTDYSYQKPGVKGIHTKTAYCKLVEKDGKKYIVVSGIYK